MVINILGTDYSVNFCSPAEDKMLNEYDGYCDQTSKKIVVTTVNDNIENFSVYQMQCLRHEIIHAFMYESGLGENWEHKPIGHEETTVDWIASQFPKMLEAFQKTGAL